MRYTAMQLLLTHCGCQAVIVLMQSQLQTQPLASLITYTAGQPISVVAGAAIALANRSDLNVLRDIERQRVYCTPYTSRQGWFVSSHCFSLSQSLDFVVPPDCAMNTWLM